MCGAFNDSKSFDLRLKSVLKEGKGVVADRGCTNVKELIRNTEPASMK